ncbi:hypothetical protein HNY73_013913 [Argiope bruennichi]|uniref:Uncharacterized protein n=1 Tax=Argiope bruennichi TaxID=94029 RepID=A0A8T0EM97_ARGBR|nr:hypothetical protein HNY73_013913 [Argiope bruennichi]
MNSCLYMIVLALAIVFLTLHAEATDDLTRASRMTRQSNNDQVEVDICLLQLKLPLSALLQLLNLQNLG